MSKSTPEENRSAETVRACIAPENLSAWIDGEYELTPEEREHLEHCERCSSLRKSYQSVTDALKKALDVECPENLSERLVLGVREKLKAESPAFAAGAHHYWAWTARIAAMLVLLGLIGYFAFKDGGIAGRRIAARPEVVTVAPRSGETQLRPVSGVALRGGVDIANTRFTAAGDSVTFSDASLAQVEKLARIEPKVRQVWIYGKDGSPAGIERTLRTLCGKFGIPLSRVRMNVAPGSSELNAVLQVTSYQAAMLARALKESGYLLVSPAQPQPEQTRFIGTGRESVEYSLVFSPKGTVRK